MTFGEVLTLARARLNMPQPAFARFLGVKATKSISLWERNISRPNRANLLKIKEKVRPHLTAKELAVFNSDQDKTKPTTTEAA